MEDIQLGKTESIEGLPEIPTWLVGVELLLGGINFQEDLHFSTFYLRSSLSSVTLPDYPGYTFILAAYEKGVERYYVSAHEAERTAQWLIQRSLSDPSWLERILRAIEVHSKRLAKAFPSNLNPETLRASSTDHLIGLYLRHNTLHRTLYRFARIPEALDRGSPIFSNYLRDYLREAGVREDELSHVFQGLTSPKMPSVVAEEERDFARITEEAFDLAPELCASHTPDMLLPAVIREHLRSHREQWGWLSYHGYRNRTLPSERDYVRRLCDTLKAIPRATAPQRCCSEVDVHAAAALPIDWRHRELFRLYPEIGRVKLFRRYWQLRNFYFLDHLLAEFARRLHASEWAVRCCVPEELLASLRKGRLPPCVEGRLEGCAILYSTEGEVIIDHEHGVSLLARVHIRKQSNVESRVKHGTVACIGFARGIARVVNLGSDRRPAFQAGEILVCEAADPDLIPMIRQAAAVVTQQGGVTSHASVLCRELGVPTLIGVEGLLDVVQDGDEIEVDATLGSLRVMASDNDLSTDKLLIPSGLWEKAECVGPKAANLQRAIGLGFNVPPFTLLSHEATKETLRRDEDALRESVSNIIAALPSRLDSGQSFLFRSSAIDEDGPMGSRAGNYVSVSFSLSSDPVRAIREFIDRNHRLEYRGPLILQRFVRADFCGVSIEGDPRADAERRLIVEFVTGPLNTVTTGQGRPQRFVYDYHLGEIIIDAQQQEVGSTVGDLPARRLVEVLSSVGRAFGTPTYTEWGLLGNDVWLYQVRGEYKG